MVRSFKAIWHFLPARDKLRAETPPPEPASRTLYPGITPTFDNALQSTCSIKTNIYNIDDNSAMDNHRSAYLLTGIQPNQPGIMNACYII